MDLTCLGCGDLNPTPNPEPGKTFEIWYDIMLEVSHGSDRATTKLTRMLFCPKCKHIWVRINQFIDYTTSSPTGE